MKSTRYTIDRTEEDIKNLERVRNHLTVNEFDHNYRTDSTLYRALPELYLNAVKNNQVLARQVEELQSKLDDLDQLRSHICSVIEICKEE